VGRDLPALLYASHPQHDLAPRPLPHHGGVLAHSLSDRTGTLQAAGGWPWYRRRAMRSRSRVVRGLARVQAVWGVV